MRCLQWQDATSGHLEAWRVLSHAPKVVHLRHGLAQLAMLGQVMEKQIRAAQLYSVRPKVPVEMPQLCFTLTFSHPCTA